MTSEVATSAPPHPAIEVNPRARFEILAAIMLALFLGALDQTIVGPVLPKISTQLNGVDFYTWVVTAYLVTSTAAIPVYGKLSDYFGRKPMLLTGIVLFLIGSVLSGLSQTMWQLILFRGVQGLGAGALFPISLAVIGDLFTPAERGKYQGMFGGVFGIAFLIGPFLGGVLTDNLSWHWIFFVNIPVGLISLYLIGRLLPMVHPKDAHFTLDILGVATFVGAVVPVLIALTLAETSSWVDTTVLGWFGVGFVFLVVFVLVEWRAKDPMIPLDLFRNRTFTVSVIATFFAVFGFSVLIIFLPLWFQIVQGASTTASGYLLFPFLFGLIFSSIAAGLLVSRSGRYKTLLAVALVIMAVGLGLFVNLRADTSNAALWSWMLLTGLGVGPTMAIFTLIVQNDVPFERLGTATSDLTLFRQIGTSVGLTVAFTLFRNNLSWGLLHDSIVSAGAPAAAVPVKAPPGFDAGSLTSVGGSTANMFAGIPTQLQGFYVTGFHQAFSIAIANSVWVGVGAAVISFVAILALKEKPLRAHFHAEQAARSGLHAKAGGRAASAAE
ncbi:MAG: MDR family MFS transporter [Candidatus Limnocylindrales bacterium]|jgi:EmrB/QacA subfamily drug resistance transporter